MANVRLETIIRKFEDVTAIEDITFEVPDGQFWVLVEPSGCGKSTILPTIAGLESATDGNLYIGDVWVNNVPARQRDVAMVFQNYALYPHMTIEVNLVKLLGRETLIRGSLPTSDVTLNVQAPSNWHGRPGDRQSVQLDLNQLFVFDSTTGDARYP